MMDIVFGFAWKNDGKMVDGINQLIDEKEDSVRIYALCAACEKQVKIFGQGETSRIESVYII